MPEGNINAEVAEHLREHGGHDQHDDPAAHQPSRRRIETIEILEAILLAIVAIVTALSGYQAARWDGESAKEYATSSRLRTEANGTQLTANQTLIYNAGTFTAWLQAYAQHQKYLQGLLSRRFTPEYKVAFDAWLAVGGVTDPKAPPGPRYMPQYKDPLVVKATELSNEASHRRPRGRAVPDRDRAALPDPRCALRGQHHRRALPRLQPVPVLHLPAPHRRVGTKSG